MNERDRIALLRRELEPREPSGEVLLGIGDDAAVLRPCASPLVWSIDTSIEGVHFRRDWLSYEDIGYRATMAAASDLAAMGAEPVGALCAMALPPYLSDGDLAGLAAGQRQACEALDTAMVGGNLATASVLSLTTTVLGRAVRPLTRAGARPGDTVARLGQVGLAGAGLRHLLAASGSAGEALEPALRAWRRPLAQVRAMRAVAAHASAAIDVSDGLAHDCAQLAEASGVQIVLDAEALVSPALQAVATLLGADAIELALHGGEDYAVVVTGRFPLACAAVPIGVCRAAPPDGGPAVWLRRGGAITPVEPAGFDHFGNMG